eukprot:TRINITY_DN82019_c0_g1_i1.p1 TRINITY_DN82019_c0_g1~~TRINITY_DN82019_c0_g1_i1.p1  ORF type:complete len:230 (-),score=33.36 TRINITY_DN82019_c0_g1_i1:482-1114(-)
MAVLSDAGKHCAVAHCRQCDFLPFTCSQCQDVFCLDHFRFEAHNCPNAAGLDQRVLVCPLCGSGVKLVQGEDPNITWERHVAPGGGCAHSSGSSKVTSKARCPVPGCKEILTSSGSISCPKCNLKTCLKHRFEDQHDCPGTAGGSSALAANIAAAAATVIGFTGSNDWQCKRCTLVNSGGSNECSACGAPAPKASPGRGGSSAQPNCSLM